MSTDFGALLRAFAKDDKVKWIVILIAVDFLLGVCAAFKKGEFRFSYLGDFLRRDVLGKVIPWFVLYSAGKLTTEKPIPGIDFATLADGAFAATLVALIASIGKSIVDLGLGSDDAKKAAAGEPEASRVATALVGPEDPVPVPAQAPAG